MKQLTLNSFLYEESDWELSQYNILSSLKEFQYKFNTNKLYPALSELVFLTIRLEEIFEDEGTTEPPFFHAAKGRAPKRNYQITETLENPVSNHNYNYNLIEWALPLIKSLVEEAYIIADFIEDEMSITRIGNDLKDINVGYLIITNKTEETFEVYHYDTTKYSSEGKTYISIKTKAVDTYKIHGDINSLKLLKVDLIKKYSEPFGVPVYTIDCDVDFPFEETIFPIAKRKFLSHINFD